MAQATVVHYTELKGPNSQKILSQWLQLLPAQHGFISAELLSSPQQPELALVASRWSNTPRLSVPPEAKHWFFEVLEEI